METVHIAMHGVHLALSSEFAPLPRYVSLHLPHHVIRPQRQTRAEGVPDIEILVRWETDPNAAAPVVPQGVERLGKRHWVAPGQLWWSETVRVENLSWHFRLDGARLVIEAHYIYAPRVAKLEANPHYLERKLFSLTSWLVLHPLTWYLERFRGFSLLHASAVAFDGRGILVAGLGGVGKTTTAVSLVAQGGLLLSENLLFFDAERIYSYYEPIRLDTASVELLRERPGVLEAARIPAGAKAKHLYHLRRDAVAEEATPLLLVIPRFSATGGLEPIEASLCAERLLAMNGQTREVDDYEWFASALNVAWPAPDSLQRRAAALRKLVDGIACFDLAIDTRQGIEPVTRTLLQQMRGARDFGGP